jgi:hypothetical protein
VLVPPIPPFEHGMMDHAEVFGWSRDGAALFGHPGLKAGAA